MLAERYSPGRSVVTWPSWDDRDQIATRADTDVAELRDALLEFNFATTGYRDGKSLSCFLRDDDGTLVAGIDGFTWGGYARIDYLWVDDGAAGEDSGARCSPRPRPRPRRRGCRTIVLDTHSFQAPGFYPKFGYVEIGTTLDTPVGARQFLFQKTLAPGAGEAPASG